MSDKTLQQRVEALENLFALEPCTINSSRTEVNADDDEPTQVMECQLLEDDDIQTIEELHIPGMQYKPGSDARGFFSKCWEELKVLVGVNDRVPKVTLNPGDLLLYASLNKVIKANIKFLNTGNLQLNGFGNFAVKYNELVTAFNELKTAYNNHNHGGSAATPQSAADITTTKATTIEMG